MSRSSFSATGFRGYDKIQAQLKTGILGCGWLGLPLAKALISQGHQVKGSTTTPDKCIHLQEAGITPFLIDLKTDITLPPDFLATELLIMALPFKDVARFQALVPQLQNSPLTQLLFISSTSVYLDSEHPITESAATDPAHPLIQIENLLRQAFPKQTTILRLAGLIGPGRHPGRFFARGQPLENPLAPVNLIHLDDCLQAILAIIQQKAWGEVFHLCADQHPSRQDFYARAAKHYGVAPPHVMGQGRKGKYLDNRYIKKRLGLNLQASDLNQDNIFTSLANKNHTAKQG